MQTEQTPQQEDLRIYRGLTLRGCLKSFEGSNFMLIASP